jgi:hypothetical protein
MAAINLQSTNLTAGSSILLETSAMPSGGLALTAMAAPTRHLLTSDAKSDLAVPLTVTATGGAMGITRVAGTSYVLVGEASSSSAKTDKCMWEINLPDTYNAGANIPVAVNASITGSGTLTAASCTIILAAYTENTGVETAVTVTPSTGIQMTAAGANMNWVISGTGLIAGQRMVLELTMLVTSASGANTGTINKVEFNA